MRLVILGGGGFRVPLVHQALLDRPGLGVTELVLHDVDAERLAVIAAVLPAAPGLRIRITTSLPEALRGADFVFSAIRVGGAAGRVADERRALQLGLLGQETVGAGGLAYGLRTLPVALAAARIQAEVAPGATLINFTNPAGLITQGLSTVLGGKVIGICDSPTGLVRRAVKAIGLLENAVDYEYVGINHLGWLRAVRHLGKDLLPALLADENRLAGFEEGRLFGSPVLQSLGSLPNEYLFYYYNAREITRTLIAGQTRGEVLLSEQAEFYRDAAADLTGAATLWHRSRLRREQSYLAETRTAGEERDEADLTGGGYQEVALDLMAALSGGPPAELIVNTPNGTAIPQLPADTVIETRCQVDALGVKPFPVGPLDLHQLGLISQVRASEQAVVDAVLTGSRAAALRAFAIHPLIASWELGARLLSGVLADHPELADLLG